jgi:hypothetical protein
MKQNAKSDKPFTLNSHVWRGLKPGKTWFMGDRLRLKGRLLFKTTYNYIKIINLERTESKFSNF